MRLRTPRKLNSFSAYTFQGSCKLHQGLVETDKLKDLDPNEKCQNCHHIHVDYIPEAKRIQTLIAIIAFQAGYQLLYLERMPDVINQGQVRELFVYN